MALPSYITSIERHEITVSAGNASASANLGASQNVANCVPFATQVASDATTDLSPSIFYDVYFTAGSPATVTVERVGTTGELIVNVMVVEFDGTEVEVQQDTFAMANETDLTDSVDITAVTLAKAFIRGYYNLTGGDDDWDCVSVEISFTDTDTVYFERTDDAGAIAGHFYVVEAQGTEFAVQTANPDITGGDTDGDDTINAVTMAKTMVVASFKNNLASDSPGLAAPRIWLDDTTSVLSERGYTGVSTSIEITAFVIEFADDTTVQRGVIGPFGIFVSELTAEINAVTLANSIVHSPSPFGIAMTGSIVNRICRAFVKMAFVDNDTVKGNVIGSFTAPEISWEVIDFIGGAPPSVVITHINGVSVDDMTSFNGVLKAAISTINGKTMG